MRVSGIVHDSTVDGPGLRTVVFVQGCPHNCEGCHNPQSHDFNGGTEMTVAEVVASIQSNPLVGGVTISGGEPFCQPEECLALAQDAKDLGHEVWCYTGFSYEHLMTISKFNRAVRNLLQNIDVLVDGPYIPQERDETLLYRGSSNQRILKMRNGKSAGEWKSKADTEKKVKSKKDKTL